MGKTYNLYNLEAKFKPYLISEGYTGITIRGYLSDLRYFLGWLTSTLNTNNNFEATTETELLPLVLNYEAIQSYKAYIIDQKLPLKTVNRRLSALRKFCSYCIGQGWLTENPVKDLTNHSEVLNISLESVFADLHTFRTDLRESGMKDSEIEAISYDLDDFLHTVNGSPTVQS